MQQPGRSTLARLAGAVGLAAALLVACGGGSGDGGGDSSQAQGTLKISMTDAPSCYRKVEVTVEKVRVHKGSNVGEGQERWEEIVPPGAPLKVDLLNLTNGALADLGSAEVDVGTYRDMRLVLSDEPGANTVTLLNGTQHALETPSGQASGIKLRTQIDVAEGQTTDIVLDFDACKSVVKAGNSGQHILKPVIRLSDKVAGAISGSVATTLTLASTTVTAQKDGEVVRSTVPDSSGKFKLAFLPPGTYTVVIASPDHGTTVVTSVPVDSANLTLNDAGSPITPMTSPLHTVSGKVMDGASAVGEAFVTAWQGIAGRTLEITSMAVDYDLGTYSMKLPQNDARVAPYDASSLVFALDGSAGGAYTLKATAPDRTTLTKSLDTGSGVSTTDFDFSY